MESYSILINTCDKFEDCWDPFFKLWSIYWPDNKAKIYLNTEYKEYLYEGLNIIPVKCCKGKQFKSKYAPWSQCLLWALDSIDTDIVLYMQEDYFLNGAVKNAMVEHYVQYMEIHPDVPCIQLSSAGIPDGNVVDSQEHLNDSDPNRISYACCQASLWRKSVLQKLVRAYESAWNFEYYGSKRAKYYGYRFLTVNHEWLRSGHHIIPYFATGIVRGKWLKPVDELFAAHDIHIDFQIRGFYSPERSKSLWQRLIRRIQFNQLKSEVEILRLNIQAKL